MLLDNYRTQPSCDKATQIKIDTSTSNAAMVIGLLGW